MPGVMEQFRHSNNWDMDFARYDIVKITGGEPFTLGLKELYAMTSRLKYHGAKKIVICTNGLQIDRMTEPLCYLSNVYGYDVGVHEEYMAPEQYVHVHNILSKACHMPHVRFLAIRQLVSPELLQLASEHGMNMTLLELNQGCDNPNEERVRIDLARAYT